MIINQIINKIRESNRIAITFHTSPDGDSLGSSLGLLLGLRHFGKDVYIMCKEELPSTFEFLPQAFEIDGTVKGIKENTDCVICLDCGNIERLNFNVEELTNRAFYLINIDHHLSNDLFGDLNHVNTNAAAVGEIVYQILRIMDIEITKDIAECLYTSLLTDTGSFRHSNTTSVTHSIAGDLINLGLDFSEVHRKIFDNKKFEALKLQAMVMKEMYLTFNNKVCVMKLTKEMVEASGAGSGDASELVSLGTKINTVEVCLLIKEADDASKISLRSKSYFDVRKICEKFGGGGHVKAAGTLLKMNVSEAEKTILKELENGLI